jgi:hypothetical protein
MAAEIVRRFDHELLDESACRLMIAKILKPSPICPNHECRVSLTDSERDRLYAGKTLICTGCGVKHSLRSGTNINGVHCDYRDIVLVTVMRYWRVPVDAIATATHISSATVRRLVERFQFTGSL